MQRLTNHDMVESAASCNLQADDISTFGDDDVGDRNFYKMQLTIDAIGST